MKAAEMMSEDINDVMTSLASDMSISCLQTFSEYFCRRRDFKCSDLFPGGVSGSLVTVQQMIVRSEDDIRRVSQELYNLIQTGSRAQGRFSQHKEVCRWVFI